MVNGSVEVQAVPANSVELGGLIEKSKVHMSGHDTKGMSSGMGGSP